MAIYNKPDENVFASSARQGEVSNFPDIGRGWGISFDQTGGIPPMEWFNFLFKRNDEKFGYLFQRGLSEWSATQSYPEGALVQYKNLTYKAKRANTNKKPDETQSSDWQRWGFTQSELKSATLTESGITQLLTSINSNDETKSATPKSVKMAYDKGAEAKTAADKANLNADGRVSKSGDTMTGDLSLKQGDWSGISLYNNDGYYLRLEGNNHANGTMLTAVYRKPNGENVAVAILPKRDGTIAYVNDVVAKSGDSMKGTLTFTGATENYYIGNYSWRMPIKFSGDAFIGNEVTGIGFNNNGALNLGGRKNSPEFIVTIDSEGIYTGGVMRATGHTAKAYGQGAFANQWDDKKAPYVVHNPNANGQNIYYPFIKGFNTNGNQYGTAFSFGYMTPGTINQFGSGAIHLLTDSGNGKIWWFGHDGALRGDDFVTNDGKRLSDLPKERLIWQGSTDNQITVNAQVSKGVLFVLMDTPHGANANRPIWFSAPIEQCHDTRIGEYDTGGTGGDYNYVTLALLHRNGNNITITPQSDGRKPRIKKVVVFG